MDADRWLQQNYAELFERELEPLGRYEAQWPSDRSFETFLAWFDVVFSPTVDDMRDTELPERPATCDPLSLRQVLTHFLGSRTTVYSTWTSPPASCSPGQTTN